MKRLYQFLTIIGIGVLLFILALAVPVALNSSDFSIYNAGWNGCSTIAIKTYKTGKLQPTFSYEENELTLTQRSFADYALDAQNAAILIIGPRTTFSPREGAYIQHFLENGGMLFLADDFGTGNDLLERINASSRFSGHLMLDLSFEKNASFVTVFDFLNRSHPLTMNVSTMLLNYPTSLIAGRNTTVFAVSTEISWLDKNLDGKEDTDESSGPFPVLAIELYGKGEIVLFSGPSLLINSMQDQLGNKVFRENLFQYLYQGRDTVIIDESHRDVAMPLRLSYVVPSTISFELKVSIVLLVLCAYIVAFTRIPRYVVEKLVRLFARSKEVPGEPSFDTMVDEVMEKHPSWRRKRLEDIVVRLR